MKYIDFQNKDQHKIVRNGIEIEFTKLNGYQWLISVSLMGAEVECQDFGFHQWTTTTAITAPKQANAIYNNYTEDEED